jgi:hypothetical protein
LLCATCHPAESYLGDCHLHYTRHAN